MFGEAITFGEGLVVTALGMGVTFAALIALSFLLDVLRIALYREPKKDKQPAVVEDKPVEEPAVAQEEKVDSEELVAVITAAIAASLQTTTHNIVVRNITRVPDVTPAWGKSGRIEVINSRF